MSKPGRMARGNARRYLVPEGRPVEWMARPLQEPSCMGSRQADSSEGARILIVDDEPDMTSTLVRLLRRSGHTCLTASSGEEAAFLLDAGPLDLVVTDLRLPGIDGLTVSRHARAKQPPVPVVLISGRLTPDTIGQVKGREGLICLAKPFLNSEFLDAVRHALGVPSHNAGGGVRGTTMSSGASRATA